MSHRALKCIYICQISGMKLPSEARPAKAAVFPIPIHHTFVLLSIHHLYSSSIEWYTATMPKVLSEGQLLSVLPPLRRQRTSQEKGRGVDKQTTSTASGSPIQTRISALSFGAYTSYPSFTRTLLRASTMMRIFRLKRGLKQTGQRWR
jgi:hypothetical protein